ncbi:hypothetical protein FDP41_008407 [Naegleria fowleri]|uniref:Cyanocobalamin reductase (cyanide-eliminating) n=1 Tax=Naegleria fowleri TaxID=5763 RepID=A0A6A5BGR9_NAEFO|nr:uncharacterized protein FDP41_008407 [Naegleria fowleri]KAF0973200.1 hypothetical protein FDP41_008407 [Naegleria fowleri]CAG4717898.1 unnamed protein product [Naegleria fowleri]
MNKFPSFCFSHLIRIQQSLKEKGFEIFQPFPISRYHDYYLKTRELSKNTMQKNINPYERLSSDNDHCLAVLIGNTKSLWPHFTTHLKKVKEVGKNPLDQYVVETVNSILQQELSEEHHSPSYTVYFSHEFEGNHPRVAIQVAGQVSGVAYYENEVSYLSFHPQYGPWFAFRAVICFKHVKEELLEEFTTLFRDPLNSMSQVFKDIATNENMSEQYLEGLTMRMKAQFKNQLNVAMNSICSEDAQLEWIKLRDIPHEILENEANSTLSKLGREWKQHRYNTAQMMYHYFKNNCFQE